MNYSITKKYLFFFSFLILFLQIGCQKNNPPLTAYLLGEVLGSNYQVSAANTALPVKIKVQVLNAYSDVVQGDTVIFTIVSGGGSLSNPIAITDTSGFAETDWIAGNLEGVQTMKASVNVPGISITFYTKTVKVIKDSIVDLRDGNVYETITLNGQTWMAENLRYDVPNLFSDSLNIDTSQISQPYNGRYYSFNVLMNGNAVSDAIPSGVQGICPIGWHLPSKGEWDLLYDYVGDSLFYTFTALKSNTLWDGTNITGFNAVNAGAFVTFSYSGPVGFIAAGGTTFWSSSEIDLLAVCGGYIFNNSADQMWEYIYLRIQKSDGFSCRCVKD